MTSQEKLNQLKKKLGQSLEQLGEALDEWLNKQKPQFQPIPLPVDRPYRKKNE